MNPKAEQHMQRAYELTEALIHSESTSSQQNKNSFGGFISSPVGGLLEQIETQTNATQYKAL